jgi:hypothetical protein
VCNIAITNTWFKARPVVYILYRKALDNNIFKQWELGWEMVISLVIDFWGIGKGGTKMGGKR